MSDFNCKTSARPSTCKVLALGLACGLTFGLHPSARASQVDDLLAMDFQRLLDVQVSAATRNEERAFSIPAALFVLSSEDIRRSGHRHLADLLRDVPGLHVGRFDGNKWAVSSRNALSRFASTLLVMIDGRPVYTPLTGGVRWEVLNLPLADIERIEVVRGPGGPLWGANAVDGIVSVITRPAKAQAGTSAVVGLGMDGDVRSQVSLHQGLALGPDLHGRLSAQSTVAQVGRYAPSSLSNHRDQRAVGSKANDGGWSEMVGGRLDGRWDANQRWSLQAQRSRARFSEERASSLRPLLPNRMGHDAGFLMGEWQVQRGGARGVAHLSVDWLSSRDDILRDDQRIVDLDIQWSDRWRDHQWTVGAGWRDYDSLTTLPPASTPCVACFGVWPAKGGAQTLSLFAQDQWLISDSVQATAGLKVERYRPARSSVQPTLRLAWTPGTGQTLWLGATRAVRAPTRLERDSAAFNVPPNLFPAFGCREIRGDTCLIGDPNARLWSAEVLEAGWRAQLGRAIDLDLSLFSSQLSGLGGSNGSSDRAPHIKGAEASLRWQVRPNWSLLFSGSLHDGSEVLANQARSAMNLLPRHKALLQSRWSPAPNWELDLRAERTSALRRGSLADLPGHWRLDARMAWRTAPNCEWSLSAHRLNDPKAVEYYETLKVNTVGTRGLMLGLRVGL
ncbi:TonB-dependent receptor plug domain-containing protein [Inhella sp.]|uniref:TonB-dependent receptor plug domain-containing protein n=1 Tax=Inhella sp. TaxID=1921806 RepID=UPI0035B4C5B3